MTDEQRNAIVKCRERGKGYRAIATELGLSENTVKSFCRRKGLGNVAVQETHDDNITFCKCCGKEIQQIVGRKKKIFCTDRCRNKWWNQHLDIVKRKAIYKYKCPTCGKEFEAYGNANRKYCCHECYVEDRFGGTRYV